MFTAAETASVDSAAPDRYCVPPVIAVYVPLDCANVYAVVPARAVPATDAFPFGGPTCAFKAVLKI